MRRILHSIPQQFRKYSHTAEFRMKRKICSNTPHHAEFQCGVRVDTEYWNAFPHLDCRIPHEAENFFHYSASSGISMRSSVLIRSIGTLFHIWTAEFCMKQKICSNTLHQAEFQCKVPHSCGMLENVSKSNSKSHQKMVGEIPSSKIEFFRP